MQGIATLLIILLMAMPSLEVIKTESKSDYDKFVLTLPITRSNVVQSHYTFYFCIVIIGAVLSYCIFYVYNNMTETPTDSLFNIVAMGLFVVLVAGSIVYPLLYIFGANKSDAIVLGGGIAGFFARFGFGYIVADLPLSSLKLDLSITIPILFITVGIILYIFSYFIALVIYQKKEF
ncbi:hypothetical protein GCM10008986_25770 [Salinibacillus aidingensis]|uniref:ABC-2 type transport system permease protein n=2 Tax=Salinibacillus aidingensis TaxID=237684 RepID=A0ABP3LC10_9BACI